MASLSTSWGATRACLAARALGWAVEEVPRAEGHRPVGKETANVGIPAVDPDGNAGVPWAALEPGAQRGDTWLKAPVFDWGVPVFDWTVPVFDWEVPVLGWSSG